MRISNAEIQRYGDADDVVWFVDPRVVSGWLNGDYYIKYGDVLLGGGSDVAYIEAPEFIASGQLVGNEEGLAEPLGHDAVAAEDMRLTVRGEDGDDALIIRGGVGAILEGGAGEDFLFNSSFKGQLYGGAQDGSGAGETDIFWFSAGSFIMDAEREDILQMFGVPLSGGSNSLFGFEA